jgi:hypothetical protein
LDEAETGDCWRVRRAAEVAESDAADGFLEMLVDSLSSIRSQFRTSDFYKLQPI